MANNAIALQTRAPNTDFIGNAIRNNAAVINQRIQQEVAQRQAETARQTLAMQQSKDARDADAARITRVSKAAEIFRDQLAAAGFGNIEGIRAARELAVTLAPEYKNVIAPAEVLASDQNRYNQAYMTADQLANKRFGTAVVSTVTDPTNNQISTVNAAGMPGASFSQTIPDITGGLRRPIPSMPAPAAAPAPTASAELPASGDPIEAAAQAIVAGKPVSDPAFSGLSNEQFSSAQQRAQELGTQPNPPLRPMSYTPSAQQPDLANIVQTMMDTGVVSQANVAAMRQAAGPGKDAQIAQILREHGVRIMPDEGMPGARMGGGEYDPTRDAAAMQPAQYYPSEYPAARGKPPMQGPVPGVYNVPTSQVHAKARAERETPKEIYEAEKAKAQAQADVARNAPPKPLTAVQETTLRNNMGKNFTTAQTTIDTMQRVIDTVEEMRRLSPDVKEAITGYSAYLPSLYGSTKEGDRITENLKGLVAAMGRSQAQLSGSLGNMAVQEWKIVSDQIAGLDLHKFDRSGLDRQLDTIAEQARAAETRVRDAYEQTHAEDFARYPGRFQLRSPASQRAHQQTTGGGGRIQSGPYKGMTADEVERRILGGGR